MGQGGVFPVLDDGLIAVLGQVGDHLFHAAVVGDVELAAVVGVGLAAAHGGGHTGRDAGHAQRDQVVTHEGALAAGAGDGRARQEAAQGRHILHEAAVIEGVRDVEAALVRTDAGDGQAHVHAGVMAQQPPGVQAGGEGVLFELVQAQQGAQAQGAHARAGGAFGGVETEGVVLLGAHRMQPVVELGIVGLLEHGHAVHAAFHHEAVFVLGHGVDFDAHAGEQGLDAAGDLRDVLGRGEFAGIAGEQQDVLQAHVRDGLGFVVGLFGAQVAARLLVVGVEAAVTALVGAVVRHVERREQVHGPAEVAQGQLMGALGHLLQQGRGRGREQGQEVGGLQVVLAQHGAHLVFGGAGGYPAAAFARPVVFQILLKVFHVRPRPSAGSPSAERRPGRLRRRHARHRDRPARRHDRLPLPGGRHGP